MECLSAFLRVRDAVTGAVVANLPPTFARSLGPLGRATDPVQFADDHGTLVAAAGIDGYVRLYSLTSRSPGARSFLPFDIGNNLDFRATAFSHDGSLFVFAQDGRVQLFAAHTGKLIASLSYDANLHAAGLLFDPADGQLALTTGGSRVQPIQELFVWNIQTRALRLHRVVAGPVVAFSPDGTLIIVTTHVGTELRDAATGDLRFWFGYPEPDAGFIAFTPDGTRAILEEVDFSRVNPRTPFAAGGSRALFRTELGTAVVVDVATEQVLSEIDTKGTFAQATLTPDGLTLVTQDLNEIQLYDVATGFPIGEPFPEPLGDTSFSTPTSDGELASFSIGGASNGAPVGSPAIEHIRVTPDAWRDEACGIVNRELTADEWKRYVGIQPQDTTCAG